MRYLKAVYFWIMAFLVTVVMWNACALRHLVVLTLRQRRDGRALHHLASIWGRTILRLMPGWKVVIEGREHLPPEDQAMVVVANHESMSDIWAMYYLGIQFRWLAKEEVFRIPCIGLAMHWAGYVPILRGNRESSAIAMRQGAARLRLGIPMFFFPEGTRSTNGVIRPFKLGAFKLAQDAQVPVLPVVIHGAGDLLPKHSWIPGRATVRIRVLPIVPPPAPAAPLEAYADEIREQIVAEHAKLV